MVYAKCSERERLFLWEDLYQISVNMTSPWIVGGDFNIIMNDEEKLRGLPVLPQETEDFAFCINSHELEKVRFKGSPYTWWNGRAGEDGIFKRLDRIVLNTKMKNWFPNVELEYLARTKSDHAPMLLTLRDQNQIYHTPFRFLKFWTEQEGFIEV